MYSMDSWSKYLEQMHSLMEKQMEKMKELEQRVDKLQSQMETSNQKPTTNIEKIEYHFDQLKIETLEGTLNIGMTPQEGKGIGVEDFALGEKPFPPKLNTGQTVKNKIVKELGGYLDNEGPQQVRSIAEQYGKQLDQDYEQFILKDIHKQLGDRVSHYIEQSKQTHGVVNDKAKEQIVEKIKQEINQSLHQFLQQNQLPKGEG